ncbi:MAG: ABC transporter permease [Ilumatobacteraceae bacterium]
MARGLWRLFVGDLRHRRLQVILLVVIVTVATAGIISGVAQQRSAGARWDDAFRRANGAHVAVFGQETALRQVAHEAGVVQASGPSSITQATLRFGSTSIDDVDVRAAAAARPAVGTPLQFDGRWLNPDADELVVERSFALNVGISTGDQITVEGPHGSVTFRVVGVYLDLLDCFYPQCDSATVWVPSSAFSRLDPTGSSTGSLLLVRLTDPSSVGAFEAHIQSQYGTAVYHVLDWQDTRHDALTVNQFFGDFLAAFGVFLLIAAGLVILSSVSSLVLARYRELGMLKATGFNPASLTTLVLIENLGIAMVGIAFGVIAGGWLAPAMQLQFAQVLNRGTASYPADIIAVTVVVVLAIIAISTMIPAWRSGRLSASLAIARGAVPLSSRPSRLARLARRLGFGTPVAIGLKDSTARPLRAWLAVLTLAVTVVAITATFGLQKTVTDIVNDHALVGDPYDMAIDPSRASRPAIESALANPGVTSWFTATDRRGAVGNYTFHVRVLGGDVAGSGFVIRQGRMMQKPGEVIAGYGLLRALGLAVGDTMPLDVSGGRLVLRIVGWYAESEDSGRIAEITLDDLRRVEPNADPGGYFVDVREPADGPAVRDAVLTATGNTAKVELADSNNDDLVAFRVAFVIISVLVMAIALVNLVGTTLLGIRERQRDIGILKTVGFTPTQIGVSVAAGGAAYAVAAVIIGVPAGLIASAAMQNAVGKATGIGPGFGSAPEIGVIAVVAGFIVIGCIALAATTARRAARAPVAEILRSE